MHSQQWSDNASLVDGSKHFALRGCAKYSVCLWFNLAPHRVKPIIEPVRLNANNIRHKALILYTSLVVAVGHGRHA